MSEHDRGPTASESDRDPRRGDLFEVSRDPILVHDLSDGRVVDANDAAERLLGYDSDALAGLSLEALGAGADGVDAADPTLSAADARDAVREALETGETRFQWRVERADGGRRWVDVSITRAQLREEERLLSFLRDVTEQRERTDEFHESRAALRELHENQMGDGSTESKVAAMLETGCRFLDMEYAYLSAIEDGVQTVTQSLGVHDALQAGATAPLAETYCQLTYGEDATDGLCTILDASEAMAGTDAYERFGLESYVGKQVVVDGEVHGTVCFAGSSTRTRPFSQAERMFVDVVAGWVGTELERDRRRTELAERKRRADALFNAPSSFIGVLEPDGTLLEANETALRMIGAEPEDVLGEAFWDTPWWEYDADSRRALRDAVERAADGETVEFDARHLTHVGSLTAALSVLDAESFDCVFLDLGLPESTGLETLERALDAEPGAPVVVLTGLDDHERAVAAIQAGAQDYLVKDEIDSRTLSRSLRYPIERKKQERELRRRTEQIEFFNSMLRHDMGNDLQLIRSRAAELSREVDGERAAAAADIVDRTDDIIDLTRKVRSVLATVTSEDRRAREVVDLVATLESEAERVRAMAADVSVSVDAPEGVYVLADDLLGDVLKNVLSNAVEHGGDGATTIEVVVEERDDADAVAVVVGDDGPGIDDPERVLERGETAGSSPGTGFGLYFVSSMVDAYGGRVGIGESGAGGADVVVELPAA
ncbi:PAS domain-containing protein [Halorubellus salinus]|uniref:PAS domain-containing protein n=1 Tax=Halorubellus salinus TaxID=755309 RepID=UPI001D0977CE|nr:PAS domain-containing protein [Halorubellus salinus]